MKNYVLILFFFGYSFLGMSQKDFMKIYDLSSDWMVYEEGNYVPYLVDIHRNYQSKHVWIIRDDFKSNILVIHATKAIHLFIDSRYFKTLSPNQWHNFELENLSKRKSSHLLITVFCSDELEATKIDCFIGSKKITTASQVRQEPLLKDDGFMSLLPRKLPIFTDFSIIILFFLLLTGGFFWFFNIGSYYNFVHIFDAFSLKISKSINFSFNFIHILAWLSLFSGFVIQFSNYLNVSIIKIFVNYGQYPSLLDYFLRWLLLSLILVLFFIFRLALIYLVGKFYQLNSFIFPYFFKSLQPFFWISTVGLGIIMLYYFSYSELFLLSLIKPLSIAIYFLGLIRLFLILKNAYKGESFFLLLYICSVEFFPLLLLIVLS